MKRSFVLELVCMVLLMCSSCVRRDKAVSDDTAGADSLLCPKYATGYQVKSQDGVRLVDVGKDYHFALVTTDDAKVPEGYTKVRVPIKNTICMTALQLSNFTILDAHDVTLRRGEDDGSFVGQGALQVGLIGNVSGQLAPLGRAVRDSELVGAAVGIENRVSIDEA